MRRMKAYTNLLKSRVNMALRRGVISNYPAYASIDPASYCQLRCPACPTGLRLGTRASANMSWERYKSIIDEVGDYLFRIDLYNWGEPFLNKQTPEFIQYAESKKIRVWVHSNLSMRLSDDYIHRLVRSGLEVLAVSIDGATQETYSIYRRGGDLLLVRENMLRIQAAKKELGLSTPIVVWKYLAFQHNDHEVETARNNYRDWGADGFSVSGAFMPWIKPYDQQIKPSTQYNCVLAPEGPEGGQRRTRKKGRVRTCSWLYQGLVLNANGKISPCCAIQVEDDDFGEYSVDQGFFRAWNGGRFVDARRFFAKRSKTKDSKEAKGEEQSTCERCPASWLDFVMGMPENEIAWAMMDEVNLLVAKKDLRSLLYLPLAIMAGGKPVWRHFRVRVANKVKYIWAGCITKAKTGRQKTDSMP